jgi:ubiquinone/menaquinone biosynthesis C-methylase UbiE
MKKKRAAGHHNHTSRAEEHTKHDWGEKASRSYAEAYGEHPTNRITAENAELETGHKILDIGCGTGSALRAASEIIENGELVGLDISPTMIEIAKAKGDRTDIRFTVGVAQDLPFESDYFDRVLAINTVHHWSDHRAGLDELNRVLAPGGRAVIVDEIFQPSFGGKTREANVAQYLEEIGQKVVKRFILQVDKKTRASFLITQK